jgi:autotransporter-associated beta strand protein
MTINGGTLRLSGYSFSFDSLSGTRGTIENRSATSPSVVSIGAGQLVAQVNTYSGILTDGAAASLSLVKDGVGTEVLTGTNTYSGPTWVSNGVLLINGQLTGTGVVYVVTNGTLGGYGSVSNVTLVGGKVSPGPAKTNFLIRGSAVVNTGSSYKWEITNAVGIAGTHWDPADGQQCARLHGRRGRQPDHRRHLRVGHPGRL